MDKKCQKVYNTIIYLDVLCCPLVLINSKCQKVYNTIQYLDVLCCPLVLMDRKCQIVYNIHIQFNLTNIQIEISSPYYTDL